MSKNKLEIVKLTKIIPSLNLYLITNRIRYLFFFSAHQIISNNSNKIHWAKNFQNDTSLDFDGKQSKRSK